MQVQGSDAQMWSVAVYWMAFPRVSWLVQAKVSPYLHFAQGTLPELESSVRRLLLVLGLEIPR